MKYPDAKTLLAYQMRGSIGIVLLIITGFFGHSVHNLNSDHQARLVNLEQETYQRQKAHIKSEIAAAKSYISYMSDSAERELKKQAKAKVEQAIAITSAIYLQQRDHLSETQLKFLIKETLRSQRFFAGRGYYFIAQLNADDSYSNVLNAVVGIDSELFLSAPARVAGQSVLQSIRNPGGAGFAKYQWPSPEDTSIYRDKITYSQLFTPYGWVIGSGDYIDSFASDLRQSALQRFADIKIGQAGYISVIDKSGKILLNPALANKFGSSDFPAALGKKTLAKLLRFSESGGGFINYDWEKLTGAKASKKLALVEFVKNYHWIILAGAYDPTLDRQFATKTKLLHARAERQLGLLIITLVLSLLAAVPLIFLFGRFYKRAFAHYQANIESQQQRLQDNTKQLIIAARFFESSAEGILVTNPEQKIIAVNPICCATTGYSEAEIIGSSPALFSSGKESPEFYQQMWQQINETGKWQGEMCNQRKNGELYPQWISISSCHDEQGDLLNYIAIFSDITQSKAAERQLLNLAQYDPLTELANRRLLTERVDQAINYCNREQNQQLALMFIDLDRFKNINDSLGHAVGDKVLQITAQRLLKTFRSSDTVCRLGGDEFIILVRHAEAEAAATQLANRVLKELADPLHIEELDLVVTTSIGIALYPDNGKDFGTLMKNADAALYHAKSKGRNNFQFFTEDMNVRALHKLSIERGLRSALKHSEFELYYQAQYDLATGVICGCEALLRWNRPSQGVVPPDEFISIAEDTGIIIPIGRWVLEQACRQAICWQQRGLIAIPIAVNVSSAQFNQELVPSILEILAETGLDPKWLVIEVTESALMDDPEFTRKALLELQAAGIEIALDDFGTGYSSLAYLKRFPINKLKIDRTFIKGLPEDKDDIALTRSIIDIARNLNMLTIAEGVETEPQRLFLSELGCCQMQGFLKARPLAKSDFESQILQQC
ncbi:MAG: hypothetical protein OFPII_20230 [Osedax symbiont Rs1]|nr:MAG: hypothetical protein OFPII_20230 [Osedax symbiont Rs1]